MIKLINTLGYDVIINPSHIICLLERNPNDDDHRHTHLEIHGGTQFAIRQTPDEILELIKETYAIRLNP